MKSIFVLHDFLQDSSALENVSLADSEGVIILVVADKGVSAGGFDDHLNALQKKASALQSVLAAKNIPCDVMLEWGSKKDAALAVSQRENGRVLNEF